MHVWIGDAGSSSGVETAEADSGERERETSEDEWSIPLTAAERGREEGERRRDERMKRGDGREGVCKEEGKQAAQIICVCVAVHVSIAHEHICL